ncbi:MULTISPECIES: hypothetical protein [Aphanothece]|uniref:hypothetical protein n=1 Tax=Aphanothece TaxID=1121 RepID=UPI003985054F
MALVRQLLLLPLLAPLLAVLLVGAFNPRPPVALRLLTWTSPALPIGVWLMVAAAGGAGLSALGTGLALRTAPGRLQRQVRRPLSTPETASDRDIPRRRAPEPAQPAPWPGATAGPTRAAGEASPTVAVPYRVIRRGQDQAPVAGASSSSPSGPVPGGWDRSADDGWDQAPSDAW